MLTGRLSFEGETTTDTLARIIEREPEWDRLPPTTPPNIRILLRRCLAKVQLLKYRCFLICYFGSSSFSSTSTNCSTPNSCAAYIHGEFEEADGVEGSMSGVET